jgi:hypothetical protein
VDDISDHFLEAISRFEELADAVTPQDAHRQLDETSMQVFWRTWPGPCRAEQARLVSPTYLASPVADQAPSSTRRRKRRKPGSRAAEGGSGLQVTCPLPSVAVPHHRRTTGRRGTSRARASISDPVTRPPLYPLVSS